MVACSEVDSDESYFDGDSMPITFATSKAQLSVETKASGVVTHGVTDFGNYSVSACDREEADTRVNSSGFEVGDEIGVYLYYNYYFAEYAESVILDDATLTVGSSGSSLNPQRLWTFSTLGGDVPTALLAKAYYPKSANVDFTYATSDASSHLYWAHDSATDLLIATQHYYQQLYLSADYTGTDVGAKFKEYITVTRGGEVELPFNHQLATLSFYIYKAADYANELTIKSLKVKYTSATHYDTTDESAPWRGSATAERVLTVTENGTLGSAEPTSPLTLDNGIYLPPNSVINSIAFSFDGVSYTYTWHPHIVDMAVKDYKILFELDPARAN